MLAWLPGVNRPSSRAVDSRSSCSEPSTKPSAVKFSNSPTLQRRTYRLRGVGGNFPVLAGHLVLLSSRSSSSSDGALRLFTPGNKRRLGATVSYIHLAYTLTLSKARPASTLSCRAALCNRRYILYLALLHVRSSPESAAIECALLSGQPP